MSVNKFIGTGNLAKDAQLKHNQSGFAILEFTVAVNNRRKVNGEWEDDPCFLDCTMFGNRAEKIANYLAKGTKVTVEGKLRQESWTSKEGQKRSKISLVVDELEFMSSGQRRQEPEYVNATYVDGTGYADDAIPF